MPGNLGYHCTTKSDSMKSRHTFLISFLLLQLPALLHGQTLAEAVYISQNGDYKKAERMFSALKAAQPADPDPVLARAYNLSWMGRHNEAVYEFEKAMALGADKITARVGLGYAAAWGRHYALAAQSFSKVLKQNPQHAEAARGLAFTRLWQGSYHEAIRLLSRRIQLEPDDYDLHIALGQAYLHNADPAQAKGAFERALVINPASDEARQLLKEASARKPFLETDIWMGFSRIDGSKNRAGLRGLQAMLQLKPSTRAWLKYDNTLALDILQFARADRAVPLYAAGLSRQWNTRLISELEYGLRVFDDRRTQHLISGAQVWFLPKNIRFKGGGFVGIGAGRSTEWMAYGALNMPLGRHFRVEPTYFYITPALNASEHRLQLGLQYRSSQNLELNLYGLYGRVLSAGGENAGHIRGWSLTGLYPFGEAISGQLILRQEQSLFYRFTSAAAGLKVRLY